MSFRCCSCNSFYWLLWIAVSIVFCVWIFYLYPPQKKRRNHGNPLKGSQCESAHGNKPLATWCGCLAALHFGGTSGGPGWVASDFLCLGSRYAKNTNSTQMPHMPNEPMPVGSHVEAASFVSDTKNWDIFELFFLDFNVKFKSSFWWAIFPNRRTASRSS